MTTANHPSYITYASVLANLFREGGIRPIAIFTITTLEDDAPQTRIGVAYENAVSDRERLRLLATLEVEADRKTRVEERPPNGCYPLEPTSPPVPELRRHPWSLMRDGSRSVSMLSRRYGFGEIEVLYLEAEDGTVLVDVLKETSSV